MRTDVRMGPYTFDEFTEAVRKFHGYAAPGLIIGGFMVQSARRHIPEGVLFDAIAETSSCLPDAVQLLTPCTAGNGWLRVHDLGRYALSLFDKRTGAGVRVFLDPAKLDPWPLIRAWFLKLTPKRDQDPDGLREEMRQAGESVLTLKHIRIRPENLGKKSKGPIAICPLCQEAYPARHGRICLGCRGGAPAGEDIRAEDGCPFGK